MVESHGLRTGDSALNIFPDVVVADDNVRTHLRCGSIRRTGEQTDGLSQLNGLSLHHTSQLTVTNHRHNRHAISMRGMLRSS